MVFSRIFKLVLLLASITALAPAAVASPITLLFNGVVTYVGDPTGNANGAVAVGNGFSATLTYDPTAPSVSHPEVVPPYFRAEYLTPATQFSVQLGTWNIEAGPVDIASPERGNGIVLDLWDGGLGGGVDLAEWSTYVTDVDGLDVPIFSQYGLSDLSLLLAGGAGILPSLSPADIPLDPSAWDSAVLELRLQIDPNDLINFSYFVGEITSIQVVPEPATWMCVGGGLLWIGVRGRLRSKPPRTHPSRRQSPETAG